MKELTQESSVFKAQNAWMRAAKRPINTQWSLPGSLLLLAFSISTQLTGASAPPIVAGQTHWLVSYGGQTCADGRNEYGELGDGTQVNRLSPVGVTATTFASVSTGYFHSIGLKSDGTVWTWGDSSYGDLGNNSGFSGDTPFQVPTLSGMVSVAAGEYYSLAVKSDGTVWAWGYNGNGQLGDGTTTSRSVPTQVIVLTNAVAVATWGYTSYALKSDGTVWAWGYNGNGEMGNGTTTQSDSPVQVSTISSVVAVAAGQNHALALKSDGTLWTWGYNGYGQLGDGTTTSRTSPVQVTTLASVVSIAGGLLHSAAVTSNGNTYTWGYNGYGQLGLGNNTAKTIPTQVPSFANASAVAAGTESTVVLKNDGSIWAWGDNTYGQLGNGTTTSSLSPVNSSSCSMPLLAPTHNSSTSKRIAASQNFSLAVKNDGTVESWGQNQYGQLGDGSTTNRSSPVQAQNLTNMTSVAAGWYFSLGVKSDGTAWGWGYNGDGELGNGSTTNTPTPIQVPGLTNMIAVAAGQYFSLGLRGDGTVWAWGYNNYGQLGNGTTTEERTPVQITALNNVVAIAAGADFGLAVKSDGTVWGWGDNGNGVLGLDNETSVNPTPSQMLGMTGAIAVAAGQYHTLVLRSDGTVWTCGYNGYGQLGTGATTAEVEIVRAAGLTNVTDIAAGSLFSLAVKSDGTLWTWGNNNNGQLAQGSTTNATVPTQATVTNGLGSILSVAAGLNHALALRSDGTFFAWGDNTYGQFGEASPTQSTVAVTVPVSGVGPFYNLGVTVAPAAGGSVTASPASVDGFYQAGTQVCLTESPATGYVFSSWTGTALDQNNCLTMSANASVTANYVLSPNLRFVPVTPCRVVDTRYLSGAFGPPILSAGQTRAFPLPAGGCSIPPAAAAYSLNVTVVPQATLNYLTIWPTGEQQPLVSTLNSDGRIKANAAIVPAGTNGAVSVYVTDAANVILDIDGYFVPASTSTALAFYPVTPCRIADTRNAAGPLGGPSMTAGQDRTFPVQTSACGLPANAQAYSLNFTAVPSAALQYLTTWPTGQTRPVVSTLNDNTGTVVANAAIVPAGTSGSVDVYVTDQTDVVIDVNGYFAPAATGGLSLYTLAPCRVADTRSSGSPFSGSITINATTSPCAVTSNAAALVSNATVVPQGSLTYLTLWPTGTTQPIVSTLNAYDGAITSNMAIVPATAGSVNAFASNPTYLILDISGYFAP